MLRRLLPLLAEKSRNSFVRTPIPLPKSVIHLGEGSGEGRGVGTGNGVIASIFRTDSAISVAVESRHGFLGEETEGFFEDCSGKKRAGVNIS